MTDVILCDVDGVIADIDTPIKAIMGKHFDPSSWDWGKKLAWGPTQRAVDAAMDAPGFVNSLLPYPGAVEFINTIRRSNYDLVFLTHANKTSPTWMWERTCWLQGLFPDAHVMQVSRSADKAHVFGKYLIDDKSSNVKAWADRWRTVSCNGVVTRDALLFDRPYNRAPAPGTRVFGYDHALQVMGLL